MQKAGDLSGYATGAANDPKEDEEEENAADNCKQPARNPVGGSHGWGKENAPMSDRGTLDIPGGAAGRLTKQTATLPTEGNVPRSVTTVQ